MDAVGIAEYMLVTGLDLKSCCTYNPRPFTVDALDDAKRKSPGLLELKQGIG